MGDVPLWLMRLLGDATPPNPTSVDDVHALRLLANGDARATPPTSDAIAAWHVGVEIRGGDPPLTAEVVVPAGDGPHPVLLWMHGGAWCVGNAAGARGIVGDLAAGGFLVVNLDYSLAPEHPFPQALVDVLHAWGWIGDEIASFGGDRTRVTLGGTSAGANLAAAAVAASNGDALDGVEVGTDLPDVRALLLLYGVFDFTILDTDLRSNVGYVEHFFNAAYLGEHFRSWQSHPLVSPARSTTLSAFPPALVSSGARDHLLPQSLAMIDALARAGVAVRGSVAPSLDHSFDVFDDDEARHEVTTALEWLRTVLSR